MKNNPQLITVENFRFTVFDSVPKPTVDQAYILYREGRKSEQVLVITNKAPVLSNQIRSGKYNKKGIVSMVIREILLKRETADETGNFKFFIDGRIAYSVKDPAYVFVHELNIDEIVNGVACELLDGIHRKYGIERLMDLEDELKKKMREKLTKLHYLNIYEPDIKIVLDERGKRIIDSNLDTMANSVVKQNEEDVTSLEIEQRKRLEKQKYEAEREIQEKKNALKLEQIKGFNAAKKEAGEDYGLVMAYINGEIDSVQLSERLQRSRHADMMAKINYFKELVDLDVISGPKLEQAAMKLLGENGNEQEIEQKLLDDGAAEDAIVVEDTEEY